METFTPSLDWGSELVTSLLWVAKAWVIGAVCMLAALALIARFTTWGRQFWRITGDYFKWHQSIPVWAIMGVLLLSVMIGVCLDVLFGYQSNDQFSALQAAFESEGAAKGSAIDGFWVAMLIYAGVAQVADSAKVLSPGEQQRIGFARVLLAKPKVVFLDESTSALDEGQEFALYRSLRTALPDCIVVSVSHRSTVEQHHDKRLELLGGGQWRLSRVGEEPVPV
jgi:ABC-type uncharacterized transport system fused permease/ATPase subunit